MEKILKKLKKIPLIDFGQGTMRHKTKSKKIAMKFAEEFCKPGALAADIGCGDGFWSKKLEEIGYKTISLDLEKEYEKTVVIDANKPLPFPDKNFDFIFSLDVIEHLDSPYNFKNELSRVLKQNGHMALITTNSYFWLFWILNIFRFSPQTLQRRDHKHFFCYNDIRKIFPSAKIYGFFPYVLIKFKIKNPFLIKLLSPAFVIIDGK